MECNYCGKNLTLRGLHSHRAAHVKAILRERFANSKELLPYLPAFVALSKSNMFEHKDWEYIGNHERRHGKTQEDWELKAWIISLGLSTYWLKPYLP